MASAIDDAARFDESIPPDDIERAVDDFIDYVFSIGHLVKSPRWLMNNENYMSIYEEDGFADE